MAQSFKESIADFGKIEEAIQNLPDNKKQIAEKLLSKAQFMNGELEKLQDILMVKGWTEEYKNGANQHGIKKSSEGEVYSTLIKSFNATMKQIADMIPEYEKEELDELQEFFKQKKTVVR